MVCILTDGENNNKPCELAKLIEKELCGYVTKKRLSHILAVRETALMLCDFFVSLGADLSTKNVELSALLHDITKCMDQSELCQRYGIELSDDDIASPETLHAITGAHFARSRYAISDEVFSAIEKHTVGDISMSLTDKIIFVSDYCEETRSHTECQKSRQMLLDVIEKAKSMPVSKAFGFAEKSLDYIIADILGKTVKYLTCRGSFVHGKTLKTYESIMSFYKEDEDFIKLKNAYNI